VKNLGSSKNIVIFSDIDGTMMDLTTFEIGPVLKLLPILKEKKVPLILCSAKTKAEQEKFRNLIKLKDPFIVENGGGVYIPKFYFTSMEISPLKNKNLIIKKRNGYIVLELGLPYKEIRKILCKIKKELGLDFSGFGDMSVEEISNITGLKIEDAILAKQREFDETIVIEKTQLKLLKNKLKEYGLKCIHGGRFYHIIGSSTSKGRCVRYVSELFSKKHGRRVISVGIGDSQNDLSMLKSVDIPILVEKKGGGWTEIDLPNIKKVKGIGPYGWEKGIKDILQNL
jgi:mannosyl-3-phosphoglycerate phosphatase family protein